MQRGGASPPFAEVFLGCFQCGVVSTLAPGPTTIVSCKKESVPGSREEMHNSAQSGDPRDDAGQRAAPISRHLRAAKRSTQRPTAQSLDGSSDAVEKCRF